MHAVGRAAEAYFLLHAGVRDRQPGDRGRGGGSVAGVARRFPELTDKPKASTRYRPDELLASTAIADCTPCRADSAGDRIFGHHAALPDGLHQLVLADDPVAVPDELDQHVEDLRLDVAGGAGQARWPGAPQGPDAAGPPRSAVTGPALAAPTRPPSKSMAAATNSNLSRIGKNSKPAVEYHDGTHMRARIMGSNAIFNKIDGNRQKDGAWRQERRVSRPVRASAGARYGLLWASRLSPPGGGRLVPDARRLSVADRLRRVGGKRAHDAHPALI